MVLIVLTMLALTGCGDKQAPKEVKTYKYTVAEVYEKTCIKCHGKNGEGNPLKKTPSLSDKTAGELAQDLYDIKNGGTDFGGSGTDHEIMEHNMQKLIEKGCDYDINSMAEYLSNLIKK